MSIFNVLLKLVRWLWLLLAALLIGSAVLVVLTRQLLPLADNYRTEIGQSLSDASGLNVEVGRLSGTWHRFSPTISVSDIVVRAQQGDRSGINVGQISARINPFRSLISREIIWQELNVDKVVVNAIEDEQGHWSIAGLPVKLEDNSDSSFEPLKMLFHSRFIDVDEVLLRLVFRSGSLWSIKLRDLLVENSTDFHRVLARVVSERGDEAARLIIEGRGDYSSPDDFQVAGYLRLKEVGITPEFNALARDLFSEQVEKIGDLRALVNAEFWFDVDGQGKTGFTGRLASREIPLPWLSGSPTITRIESDLVGWIDPEREWGVQFQNLGFQWLNQQVVPLNVGFSQSLGEHWGDFSASFDHINLGTATDILLKTGLLNERAEAVVAQLFPVGRVTDLDVGVSNRPGNPMFKLTGNLQNVSVQPWKGAPGVNNLSGYIEATPGKGSLLINSLNADFWYSTVYDKPINHDYFAGQIDWFWNRESSRVQVISDDLNLGSNLGDMAAHLYLDIPVGQKDKQPKMFLQVGVENSHSKHLDVLLPNNLSDGLTYWLHNNLQDVEISQLGFVYRGEFGSPQKRSIQLGIEVADGQLGFHNEWPAIDHLRAEVYVDNEEVDGVLHDGLISGVGINRAEVALRKQRDAQHLFVTAHAESAIHQALTLLEQSPLKGQVLALKSWDITGAADVSVKLDIPIGETSVDKVDSGVKPKYHVAATIKNASITNPDLGLSVERVKSVLEFNEQNGFYAKKIQGELWGHRIYGRIATKKHGLEIHTHSHLNINKLKREFGFVGDAFSGEMDLRSIITLPKDTDNLNPTIVYRSELKNVEIDLPEPLAKKRGELKKLLVNLEMAQDKAILKLDLGNSIFLNSEMSDGKLLRGVLTHNRLLSHTLLPKKREFLVSLQNDTLNLDAWLQSIETLAGETPLGSQSQIPVPVKIDLKLDYLSLSGFNMDNVSLKGSFFNDEFDATFSSEQIAGHIARSSSREESLSIDLDYLKLPESMVSNGDFQSDKDQNKPDFDPRTVPGMTFSAEQIYYGDKLLGRAAFIAKNDQSGLTISNIDADILGFSVGEEKNNTTLQWLYDGVNHSTHFDGVIRTDSVGDVQENMGWPRALEAKDASFDYDLVWHGKPWEGDVKNIRGEVSLDLKNGHFPQSTSKSTSIIMRVIGLLNTGEWLRRLKLDFSDVFSKGLSFTGIEGTFRLDRGVLTFPDPIETDMASGKMQVNGSVNLITEDLDNQIVVTLPVGTNLPWIAAMIGSLPAAAGVYLFNKIFKKEVNKFSSVTYRVSGQWADPKVEVVKIFSDNKKGGISVPSLQRSDMDSEALSQ